MWIQHVFEQSTCPFHSEDYAIIKDYLDLESYFHDKNNYHQCTFNG